MRRSHRRQLLVAAAVFLLSACGGGATGGTASTGESHSAGTGSTSGSSTTSSSGATSNSGSTSSSGATSSSGDASGSDATSNSGSTSGPGTTATSGGGTGYAGPQEFFTARVEPNMGFCRSCHVPGGVADTDKGRRMMLSSNSAEDYGKLQTSWDTLGKGVETNRILLKPSGQDPEPHSGGTPWPKDGTPYNDMKTLLSCWDNPAGCAALLGNNPGGTVTERSPLLGNPGKHFFVNQICDGAPDDTPIDWSQDPRLLMTEASGNLNNDNYAVHFNDPFEVCHNDTLFKTQARQNELLKAQGKPPIHSARPYAKTCGEWRTRVQVGHDWIAMRPTDTAMKPDALHITQDGGYGSGLAITGAGASAWNNLWKVWGLSERPANFDRQVSERYGLAPTPPDVYNPYPLPGEETKLTASFGGTGKLPLGYAQGRDANGKYTGSLGINCFICHASQLGTGEVASRDGNGGAVNYGANPTGSFMGLPNSMQDYGAMIADLVAAGAGTSTAQVPFVTSIGNLVNTTRGTHNADGDIELIFAIRDWDTLNFERPFVEPAHPSYGDQDPPAWWWLHNKARYLWFGGLSTDSARGNMYFGSVNGLTGDQVKQNEAIFESVHDWTLTVEAPDYPQGYCTGTNGAPATGDKPGCINRPLAEQGAILFHEKTCGPATATRISRGRTATAPVPVATACTRRVTPTTSASCPIRA